MQCDVTAHIAEHAPTLGISRRILLEHVAYEQDGVKGALRSLGNAAGHVMDVVQVVHNVQEVTENIYNRHRGYIWGTKLTIACHCY